MHTCTRAVHAQAGSPTGGVGLIFQTHAVQARRRARALPRVVDVVAPAVDRRPVIVICQHQHTHTHTHTHTGARTRTVQNYPPRRGTAFRHSLCWGGPASRVVWRARRDANDGAPAATRMELTERPHGKNKCGQEKDARERRTRWRCPCSTRKSRTTPLRCAVARTAPARRRRPRLLPRCPTTTARPKAQNTRYCQGPKTPNKRGYFLGRRRLAIGQRAVQESAAASTHAADRARQRQCLPLYSPWAAATRGTVRHTKRRKGGGHRQPKRRDTRSEPRACCTRPHPGQPWRVCSAHDTHGGVNRPALVASPRP